MTSIDEPFRPRLRPDWHQIAVGGGHLIVQPEGLRLALAGVRRQGYGNAQIDDYGPTVARPSWEHRTAFRWQPPLRLTLRARASGPLLGTAGFGFWNNPYSPLGSAPVLPATCWFFCAGPPSDIPLALGVPGHGWKVACLDARRPRALAWAPLAPAVLALNNLPGVQPRLWPHVQRALGIAEAAIPPLDQVWREYVIVWRADGVRFLIDGAPVFETEQAPAGPLGFVAWLDSQWAVVTPRGRFGWGRLAIEHQWLDLADLRIAPL
jgi:hypothetical protein